ncbi:hypothetical protein [Neisseria polysaccharea]|uniref:hypothetical protein n=1 Tax=Neisseria polysaccharea TaxID=489 RepID=UPI0027E1F41E|nr:hypothetical protein [Neisseria polysaccharea]
MFIVGTIVVLAGIFYCVIIAASAVWLAAVGLWQAFFEKAEPDNGWCRDLQREIEAERRRQV